MVIAALFITSQSEKQPKYPSVEKWICIMGYICTTDYLAIKMNTYNMNETSVKHYAK